MAHTCINPQASEAGWGVAFCKHCQQIKSDRELAEQHGTDERDEADAALEEAERAAGR